GSPARLVRQVSDEEYAHNLANASEYVKLARGTDKYRQIG
ncbi:MAG: gamma carbonic anhydrase family protein, partial [Spirochaetae bacterium HGW-Spirochaetae-7]